MSSNKRKSAIRLSTPTLWGVFKQSLDLFLDWFAYLYDRWNDWKKTAFCIAVGYIFVWLLFGTFGWCCSGAEPRWGSFVPSPAAIVSSVGHKVGKLACWPIRKAVECCVPGISSTGTVAGTTKLFVLNKKYNNVDARIASRGIVASKQVLEPTYTVRPNIGWYYHAPCGSRWDLADGRDANSVEIHVSPKVKAYIVRLAPGGPAEMAYLTQATYDAIQVGDVIEVCGSLYEEGVNQEDMLGATIEGVDFEFGPQLSAVEGTSSLYPKMIKAMLAHMNAKDAAQCKHDRKDDEEELVEVHKLYGQ